MIGRFGLGCQTTLLPLPACGERAGVRGVSKNTVCGESPSPNRRVYHRAALCADPLVIDLSPQAGRGDPSSLALLPSATRFHNMPGTLRGPKLFHYPLFRLLAINLAAGLLLAVLLVGGLLWLDPGGLRHLIFADRSPGVALGLLLFGFVVTFGSTAMGTAIMAAGRPPPNNDGPRGGKGR